MRHQPSHVLFLGTAGAAPGAGLVIGDLIVARSVCFVDAAVAEDRGAMPFVSSDAPLDAALYQALVAAGARPASVVTTPSVTTDDLLARRLAAFGEVEHLEAYGVARACEAEGVACGVVLGITNVVGSTGREEWKANHAAVSAKVAELVGRVIPVIREGLDVRT
jgi:nucleoside phosphorylase